MKHNQVDARSRSFWLLAVFAMLISLAPGQAEAQTPFLLKDINPSLDSSGAGMPKDIVEMGNIAYFNARDRVSGEELWRSDGTESGTYRVKDIFPGNEDSSPALLTVVGTTLFFRADDGVTGIELWRSDGTEVGTVRVKDVSPGIPGSVPYELADVNGTLFFNAADGTHGGELWKSDGTEAGTVLVKNIRPGYTSSNPLNFIDLGGTLFFSADDGSNGCELWKSDGTDSGTVMVANINGWSGSSYPERLTVVNGVLFFVATNYDNGRELWKSDGTELGTAMVKDIKTGLNISSGVDYLTALGNTLFFSADNGSQGVELWKSDGTESGTVIIDIHGGSAGSYPKNITAVGSGLFFSGYDPTHGRELWVSNGELAGTSMVRDIRLGTNYSDPEELTDFGGELFFIAYETTNGAELWKSDGTLGGTNLVADTVPGSQPSLSYSADTLTEVNGQLFFRSADSSPGGSELWKSDGTEAGTGIVKNISTGARTSWPDYWVEFNDAFYFSALDGVHGYELWKSDGTPAGTEMITDIAPDTSTRHLSDLIVFDGALYFQANGDLWTSDGSTAGTAFLHASRFVSPVEMNGYIYFGGGTDYGDTELWRTDGTPGGTTLVKEIRTGSFVDPPESLTVVGNTVFFVADDGSTGLEMWKSDGTEAGTTILKDIRSGSSSSSPRDLTPSNDQLFFVARGLEGTEVWVSDGTEAGTVLTKDIRSGYLGSEPDFLTDTDGRLFFQANAGGSTATELWTSDGTPGGTRLVRKIGASYSGAYPQNLISYEDGVVFSARTSSDFELWKSDGTYPGTVAVKEIWPGFGSSEPSSFAFGFNSLFFVANDGVHGHEIWKTDGTEAGTALLGEIVSGSPDGGAHDLRLLGGTLFMLGETNETGIEPWAMCVGVYYRDFDDDGFGDSADSTVACTCPTGYVADDDDCDDDNGDIHPGATELCDAIDNDCDGEIDDPTFAGPTSALPLGGGSCAIRLDWGSTTACDGTPVYNVYRSTSSGFDPSPSNLQVACVPQSFWIDTGVSPATPYYYVIRAENPSGGGNGPCYGGAEDNNTVEVSATATSCSAAAQEVLYFTACARDEQVQLEWVNPSASYGLTRVCWKTGSFPIGPTDGVCVNVAGGAGSYGTTKHDTTNVGGISNGQLYHYGAFVNSNPSGTGDWSAGRFITARPFNTADAGKWGYSTSATALSSPGVRPGIASFTASNDRILHSSVAGDAGGAWPATWVPASMNGPAQGRPIVLPFGTPTVGGASTIAFVGSHDGRAYAFDADTGIELWASPVLGDGVQSSPSASLVAFGGYHDVIVVGTRTPGGDSKLHGLHLADGSIAWTFDNGGGNNGIGIISSQAWVDGAGTLAYFTSRQKVGGASETVWCIDFTGTTASLLWSRDLGDIDSAPTVRAGAVYVGTNAGTVHALDPLTGADLWSAPHATGDGAIRGFVWFDQAGGGRRLYFSTSNSVHALVDNGTSSAALWAPVSLAGPSPVIVIGDDLYTGSSVANGSLVRLDKVTGTQLGAVVLGDPTVAKQVGSPSYDWVAGQVIVGTEHGVIYAVNEGF